MIERHPVKVVTALLSGVFAALALAGCAGEDNLLKKTAKLGDFATTPLEPKDFVKETRPAELNYIPVGTKVDRDARKMTPSEFRQIETDLDAQRARNESAGAAAKTAGATPPPAPLKLPQ